MTTVVNINREDYDVYIGRAYKNLPRSKWANPFRIGPDGTRAQVIEKYRQYVLASAYLMSCLHELKDKVLGCHCSPLACHGDVLVELVNLYAP